MSSHRVRRDSFSSEGEIVSSEHAVDKVRGRWRIYEYHQEYSSTSGGFLVKDRAVRRYDSDASTFEQGRFASFATKQEAIAYWERWIKKHERYKGGL